MLYKQLRDMRAYDRHYRRENIMSRRRDRAHLANRRYGSPKLIAADVAAIFANRVSYYYCGAPVDGRWRRLQGNYGQVFALLGGGGQNRETLPAVLLLVLHLIEPFKIAGFLPGPPRQHVVENINAVPASRV